MHTIIDKNITDTIILMKLKYFILSSYVHKNVMTNIRSIILKKY